jgi:hypothetical protein
MKLVSSFLDEGLNHRTGRRMTPDTIVIHVTEGDASSVISWFHRSRGRSLGALHG